MKPLVVVAVLLVAGSAEAEVTVFGSAGAESQHAPANTDSPLNPDNLLAIRERSNTADFAIFAITERERWKVKTKLRGDAADGGAQRLEIAEASLQWRVNEAVDITAGRLIEKWGTGYGWTPTAFVGPARNPTDPSDRRSLNRGNDMIRVSALAGRTDLSVYLLEGGAAAFRVHRLLGGTDVAVMLHREGEAMRQGLSVSRVFGDALELHADAAWSQDGDTRAVHAVAGGQYTWRRANVVLELHHRSDAPSREQWDAFRAGVEEATLTGDVRALFAANRQFAPLRMGREYAFLRVARNIPVAAVEAELIAITNLHDRSTVLRTTLTRRVYRNLHLLVMSTDFAGRRGSELSYVQVDRITTAGLRLHF